MAPPPLDLSSARGSEPLLSEDALQLAPRRGRRWIGRAFRGVFHLFQLAIGAATLIIGLAVVATIPVLQILSLGYLLEVSGRIARTGRIRDGFIGIKPAGKVGMFFIAVGLAWIPMLLISSMANSAEIIAPGSQIAGSWASGVFIGLGVFASLLLLIFLIVERLRPGTYGGLRDAVWNLMVGRMPYYFWLGLRGFLGGLLWLAIPISLLVAASLSSGDSKGEIALAVLLRVVGAVMLMTVVLLLPFLQARMAAKNRFAAVFEWRAIRKQFRCAPIAFWLAVTTTLLFALPLYLLKIELIPSEAAGLPGVAFVVFIFPARVLAGWAYARSQRSETPRSWIVRWFARAGMLPVAAAYVLVVFMSPFVIWHGVWGMYEQHAFLLPVPFLGM